MNNTMTTVVSKIVTKLEIQRNLFFIALGFFSRIPVPGNLDFSQQNLNRASRYFSLVGWVIGGLCGFIFYLSNIALPVSISVIFSMIVGFFLTGGFHEDGFADTCDGLGGGWSIEDKLKIMKDSRIGSYGSIGLWSILTLKYFLLLEIVNASYVASSSLASSDMEATSMVASNFTVIIAIIISHPLSRSLSTSLMFVLPYVSETETSKVKPLADSSQLTDLMINLTIGGAGLLFLSNAAGGILISLTVLLILLKWHFNRQVKGITGDLLGAAQQLAEVLIYVVILFSLLNGEPAI